MYKILTYIFVISKILNLVDWSWWLVFSPLIIAFTVALISKLLGNALNIKEL